MSAKMHRSTIEKVMMQALCRLWTAHVIRMGCVIKSNVYRVPDMGVGGG